MRSMRPNSLQWHELSFMCVCTVHRFGDIKCFVAREVDEVDGRMGRWSSDASETRSAYKSLGNGKVRKCESATACLALF